MILLVECLELALVADAASAVLEQLGVEYLLIDAVERCADAVVLAGDGLEVADDQHLAAVVRDSAERDHAVLIVVESDPAEAVPVVVVLVHRGNVAVECVRSLEEVVELTVLVILEQTPFELLVGVPLVKLTDFTAHEQQLLAGVRHHVSDKASHAHELHVIVAGHLVDQGALAVNDLVVGDRQHEVLGERVDHAERQGVVVVISPQRVEGDVGEHVVHPAHVPLVVEAQSETLDRVAGDARPSGGFLGDHHRVGMEHMDNIVELLDEVDRDEVLSAAVGVGDPLAVLAVVVEIEHRSNGVNADAVDVVHIEPEHRGGDQEAGDLISAVVEDVGAPFLVLADSPVLVLIAARAVEAREAVSVLGEVSGNPVEDNADACLVSLVDEIHQILRLAVARCRGVVAGALIAPAAVKRELGEGHELDVGVAHILDVGNQLVRQLAIAEEVTVVIFFP